MGDTNSYREGYTAFPHKILTDKKLTANDKWIWLVIFSHKNWNTRQCNPSINTIVKESGKSKGTVLASRKRLHRNGYLAWTSNGTGKVGRGRKKVTDGYSCRYTIPLRLFPREFLLNIRFKEDWIETGEWMTYWY